MNIKEIFESLIEYFDKVDRHEETIAELTTRVNLLEQGKKPEPRNNFSRNN